MTLFDRNFFYIFCLFPIHNSDILKVDTGANFDINLLYVF